MVESLTPQLGEFFGVKNGDGVLVRTIPVTAPTSIGALAEGEVAQQILEWVRDLSKPFGTTIEIAGGVGTIKL